MPRSPLPLVRDSWVQERAGGSKTGASVEVGTDAWFAWLEGVDGFAYEGPSGRFTARKEGRARGGTYWKAYQRVGGRLRREYLGKSETLTARRLDAAAAVLAAGDGAGVDEPAEVSVPGVDVDPLPPLPPLHGDLLGREREVVLARELLLERGARLVTLTGPGGVGKTHLALALADGLADTPLFQDHVRFVDLTPTHDARDVPDVIAQAFGLLAEGGLPLPQALAAALRGRPTLLVLDNCEQVLGAARDLGALVEAVPSLTILATSRAPLRLRGERELPVPPLPLPYLGYGETLAQLAPNPAVRLFERRAQAVDPSYRLSERDVRDVAEVCVRLDGLPLAIELAAARTRLLPPRALLTRLDSSLDLTSRARDVPSRHRTLRSAIAWSYDLLADEERVLFRRLAVFRGGCDLEAIQAVCGGGRLASIGLLRLLEDLVDESLVVREDGGEARFRLLETVRAFALEQLEQSGEMDEVRNAHARHFQALARSAEAGLKGGQQVPWMARLEREHANVRTALDWLLRRGEDDVTAIDDAVALAYAVWLHWWLRDHQREGGRWVERVLEHESRLRPLTLARALLLRAITSYGFVSPEETVARYQASADVFVHLKEEDPGGAGVAIGGVGVALLLGEDLSRAEAWLREGLRLYEQVGDDWGVASVLAHLGGLPFARRDPAQARACAREALTRARRTGDRFNAFFAAFNLAVAAQDQGQSAEAARWFAEAFGPAEELGDRANAAYCLEGLAQSAAAGGRPERAAELFGAAVALLESVGAPVYAHAQARTAYGRAIARAEAQLGRGAWDAGRERGRALRRSAIAALVQEEKRLAVESPRSPSSEPAGAEALSARERDVAALIAQGLRSKEIAERLVISQRTADAHADHIRRKLGLRSRAEIAAWAVANRLAAGVDADFPR